MYVVTKKKKSHIFQGVLNRRSYLIIGRQAWVMQRSLHQLDEQVHDLVLALPHAQEPLLQGAEAGHVLGDLQAQHFPIAVQELHHLQAMGEGPARQHHSRDARQLGERLATGKGTGDKNEDISSKEEGKLCPTNVHQRQFIHAHQLKKKW